jgi:nucleotide-binding universal stress UspA family protein
LSYDTRNESYGWFPLSASSFVAQAILEEALALGAGTIVLGRSSISKKEEFIFGSTSNKILHSRKSCSALWVV